MDTRIWVLKLTQEILRQRDCMLTGCQEHGADLSPINKYERTKKTRECKASSVY